MNNTKEKNINFLISQRLEKKLNNSKIFQAIMIRKGNYYLSISKRIEISKKNHANVLISIHANSFKNPKISGFSIWILSKKRIKHEVINLSKKYIFIKHKKYRKNISLLNAKFKIAKQSGYLLAKKIIKELKNIKLLHQSNPKNASFGILKSPDFPSILIETGFISNKKDEKKLNNKFYQKILVNSIYLGLKKYFLQYYIQNNSKIFIFKKY
ncbi:MAG: N-acetylmuramoyl-L-alanine amidase [Buchnera aphidicola (Nurudea yanoniella)]